MALDGEKHTFQTWEGCIALGLYNHNYDGKRYYCCYGLQMHAARLSGQCIDGLGKARQGIARGSVWTEGQMVRSVDRYGRIALNQDAVMIL